MITMQFDNWGESLYEHSIKLLTNNNILEINNNKIDYSKNSKENQLRLLENPVEAHLYWVGVGIGIECLAKSVLIKHELLEIGKKKVPNNITDENVLSVYKCAEGDYIKTNDKWLTKQFNEKGIEKVGEISTPTLGQIYNSGFKKLYKGLVIDQKELDELELNLKLFTDVRRNRDAHIYLKTRTIGSIQKDIENHYIPLINKLIEIYHKK